jgi:hypothetical protein
VGEGGVLEPWASWSDFLGKSWENFGKISSPSQNPGSHRQGIDFCIIRQHRSWERDLCHVTQPRARVNVSCSRAGHIGGRGNHKKKARERWRVGGEQR